MPRLRPNLRNTFGTACHPGSLLSLRGPVAASYLLEWVLLTFPTACNYLKQPKTNPTKRTKIKTKSSRMVAVKGPKVGSVDTSGRGPNELMRRYRRGFACMASNLGESRSIVSPACPSKGGTLRDLKTRWSCDQGTFAVVRGGYEFSSKLDHAPR